MKAILKKHGLKAAIVAAPVVLAGQAMAAVPESITTAISTAQTDSVTVAGLILAISVGLFGFAVLKRLFR